jgi:transposase
MSNARNKFSPEVRERAVRMVGEHRADYGSEWAAITSIAGKIGCTAGPAAQAASERERLKLLEREVKELRRANEILRKASAYFAQAELDRQGKW